MQRLSGGIALNLLYHPIFSITSPGFAEARIFVILVTELAASKMYYIEGEMVPNTVYVV